MLNPQSLAPGVSSRPIKRAGGMGRRLQVTIQFAQRFDNDQIPK